ncbi:MAG TPA: Rieske 2Fe-2S domain-containing protein [Streptosporangiaceae bacterium]|nr:Rieske 2Fe-2S domain-containing protein [Streptosporangiaceae bacterium]
MLTAEQNEELTQVAAGTPMGELLRRYWYPVAFTRELEEFPIKAARLLGEDFALFKTPRGRYGMLPEACPHRRASLAYGVVGPTGCAARTTAGCSAPTAPAWTSPPSGKRPTSATGSGRSPGRCRSSAA